MSRKNIARFYGESDEKPPSKVTIKGDMGNGAADISADDIKGEQRVGWWDRLTEPILYPAGSSVFTRCAFIFGDI